MNDWVGIVILSWNNAALTAACVDSARAQSYTKRFILVVDNASSSSHRDLLRQRYADCDDVELLWLERNTGYAEGNNIGMRRARERGADWFLIATQDSLLDAQALERLLRAVSSHPQAGIAGPLVLDVDGRELSCGERVAVPLLCLPRTVLRYRRRADRPYRVGGLLGCVLLISRECLEKTNGFDESYFAYYEEVDLCLRARTWGMEILCAPQAVVRHHGMRGFLGGLGTSSAELKVRNLWRLLRTHARPWDWLILAPSFSALILGSAVLYLLRGRSDVVAAMLRGFLAALRGESGPLKASADSR
jgi:GT2 family glycosyltransferase